MMATGFLRKMAEDYCGCAVTLGLQGNPEGAYEFARKGAHFAAEFLGFLDAQNWTLDKFDAPTTACADCGAGLDGDRECDHCGTTGLCERCFNEHVEHHVGCAPAARPASPKPLEREATAASFEGLPF